MRVAVVVWERGFGCRRIKESEEMKEERGMLMLEQVDSKDAIRMEIEIMRCWTREERGTVVIKPNILSDSG